MNAFPCGDCICTRWLQQMSCYGNQVKYFPELMDSSWISHIDILNTSLTELPDFSRDVWNNFFSLDIRDNEEINCTDIIKLQFERNDLLITTDCDDEDILFKHDDENLLMTTQDYGDEDILIKYDTNNKLKWMNILFIIPVLLSVALIIVYLNKLRLEKEQNEISV